MTIEGYLRNQVKKTVLSRITEPTYTKLLLVPLKLVKEGRSHDSGLIHPTSHCQRVLVVVWYTTR